MQPRVVGPRESLLEKKNSVNTSIEVQNENRFTGP